MSGLTFDVRGIPGPQGSKTPWGAESSKKVKPWRDAVRSDCVDAMTDAGIAGWPVGPVEVRIVFLLPRPKAHYRTGKRAGELRDDAPMMSAKRPDVDKLTRSTLDALTQAGIYADDAQVTQLRAMKAYADPMPVGATITVRPLPWLP